MRKNRSIYWGVFLIALATLIWEILLTRIFSATMYYHFAFMSISLAMLGFGCSGVIVFLFPKFFSREKCSDQLTLYSSVFAITIVTAILVYLQVDREITPSLRSFVDLLMIFSFIFLPYLFSGLTITLALRHETKNITTLYCYDLVGAGLGCVAVIGLLFIYDGISLVLLTAFLSALSSIVFGTNCNSGFLKKFGLVCAVLLLGLFVCNAHMYRFLKIKYVQGKPQTNIVFEEWNPINRVTVEPREYFGRKAMEIGYDSTAYATIHSFDGDRSAASFFNKYPHSFYYQVRKNADVLIIGVGGGQDVLNAYLNGHTSITGIEINPTIAYLNTNVYADFNGNLFSKPEVEIIIDEGRNFVRHTKDTYDIIHLPNVDSGVASSSGAFTFVENTLYTVEAFRDYYHRLKDDGVLWISRWRTPQKTYFLENLRILTGAVLMLEREGIKNPADHIVMLEEKYRPFWRQGYFFMKKTPFTASDISDIDSLRKKMDLDWLVNPMERIDNTLNSYIYSTDREAFLAALPFRTDPNTDDCPFFFNFLKPKHYFWKLPVEFTHNKYPVFIFKSLFVIVLFMVIVTIILPLVFFKRSLPESGPVRFRSGYIVYFCCLGLGFMLVEIPLIQKFILFLGQPLYAIAVILSTLLVFSGIGSLLSGRFATPDVLGRLRSIMITLCVLLLIYMFALSGIFDMFLGTGSAVRFIISILLIAPLGLLMGTAFPLGIRLLERDCVSMVPWMWAVNGACSVMGSIIAWGMSLNFGYNATILVSTCVYGFALLVMLLKRADTDIVAEPS